jgi:glycerophosphoryl diester phosphodiesterase
MINEAHELGLPVIPWTVNTRANMEQLMDLGVDGIISDYPTRLRTVMKERGMKLPKAYEPRG